MASIVIFMVRRLLTWSLFKKSVTLSVSLSPAEKLEDESLIKGNLGDDREGKIHCQPQSRGTSNRHPPSFLLKMHVKDRKEWNGDEKSEKEDRKIKDQDPEKDSKQ